MTIVTDETQFNAADDQGDWNGDNGGGTNGFDPPTLNDTNSTPSIYREGASCMEWVLKENITNGYTYSDVIGGPHDISNGEIIVFWFFITADADLDKVTNFDIQISSDAGFTTNLARWEAADQIYNLDYYGWFPVVLYPTNPKSTTGTIVYSSIDSIGWYATTGAAGTKLSGFDNCHSISYVGGHSQTVTMDNLYQQNVTDDLGVMLQFGTFNKTSVNIRLGDGTSTTFNETGRSLFFDNVQPEHNLGFIFLSDTGTNTFDLDGWAISWNEQTGTSPEIFTNASNTDIFRINACSFTNGGAFTARTRIDDDDTFITNTSISGCGQIDPRDLKFEDCAISNTTDNAVDGGALLLDSEGSARWKRLSFTGGGVNEHAIEITATGTYTFEDFTYSGYGGNQANNAVIRNNSGGLVTINVQGGDTPTYDDGAGATTVVNNTVTVSATVLDETTSFLQNALVLIEASDGTGPLPYQASVTITRSGSTATVSHSFHDLATGMKVNIRGADQYEYNTVHTITVTSPTAYTYTVSGTPTTPATGTIISTGVVLNGLTNASGVAENTGYNFTANQPITGVVRKSTTSPYYRSFPITGTITSTGFSTTLQMQLDE